MCIGLSGVLRFRRFDSLRLFSAVESGRVEGERVHALLRGLEVRRYGILALKLVKVLGSVFDKAL